MASLDLAAGFAGSRAEFRAKIGPALIGLAVVALLGLAFLMRHQFDQNPRDDDWTDPHQPGQNVALPLFLGPDGHRTQAEADQACRYRRMHNSLAEDASSIIGGLI